MLTMYRWFDKNEQDMKSITEDADTHVYADFDLHTVHV